MPKPNYELITSIKNPRVQQVRELLTKKSTRDQEHLYIVEGVRLAEEAVKSGILPNFVFFSENLSSRGVDLVSKLQESGTKIFNLANDLLERLSDTETSQGLLMACPKPETTLPADLNFAVIVDQLRDPGNMGTILRTATAAGVQAVFVTSGSVDPFSPKVVRAGMGSHFRLPIVNAELTEIVNICKHRSKPMKMLLAESEHGTPLWQTDMRMPVAVVIGGEANGAGQEMVSAADELINIPMPGGFESLNAAVAGSIILFEVVRQRNS